ncbi:YHS domain-containing protein [SAR202 cluster bacterium AD-804-J14_MRT_500m]|nr:YHS domain-containing protein [SAR202 cluster bacterium AD-804-J14_MRT_500m]
MAIDPICKMEVDVSSPRGGTTEYMGVLYYFCAPSCKRTFEGNPEQYVS